MAHKKIWQLIVTQKCKIEWQRWFNLQFLHHDCRVLCGWFISKQVMSKWQPQGNPGNFKTFPLSLPHWPVFFVFPSNFSYHWGVVCCWQMRWQPHNGYGPLWKRIWSYVDFSMGHGGKRPLIHKHKKFLQQKPNLKHNGIISLPNYSFKYVHC